jgi:hypothetical protein
MLPLLVGLFARGQVQRAGRHPKPNVDGRYKFLARINLRALVRFRRTSIDHGMRSPLLHHPLHPRAEAHIKVFCFGGPQ